MALTAWLLLKKLNSKLSCRSKLFNYNFAIKFKSFTSAAQNLIQE